MHLAAPLPRPLPSQGRPPLSRRSEVLNGLEQHYLTQPVPGRYFSCKLLALFAIGDLYSTRTASLSEDTFPGLSFFSRASRIMRESNERPQIKNVKCTLLLAIYSLLLNRRHSAYQLASSAVRQAIIVGIQHDIPEPLSPSRTFREHCVRVWWSAYILDRLTASRVGYPSSIQDDDISVDQPSDELNDGDFPESSYLRANIVLAKLSKEVISSLYSRKSIHVPFARRVQEILKKLHTWLERLPAHIRMETEQPALPVMFLHLNFNQHVILATRPILLHVLRSVNNSSSNAEDSTEELLQALAEACVQSARHSYRLLSDAWIEGHFPTFDFTYIQCLFSVAIVLAVASQSTNSAEDYDRFVLACSWIQQLSENGNFAAMEFSQYLKALQNEMVSPTDQHGLSRDLRSGTSTGPMSETALDEVPTWSSDTQQVTAEMALAEPFLQDFLAQTDLNLCFGGQLDGAELGSLYL